MNIAGRELRERDWIMLLGVILLVAALIASGVWLELRAVALREARAREAAAMAIAAEPKRAPPIAASVYVRTVPVHHTQ